MATVHVCNLALVPSKSALAMLGSEDTPLPVGIDHPSGRSNRINTDIVLFHTKVETIVPALSAALLLLKRCYADLFQLHRNLDCLRRL